MLASTLRPESEVTRAVLALRGTSDEVLLAAPSVGEVLYGLWAAAARRPEFVALADWWSARMLGPEGVRVVMPDTAVLIAAARARARHPKAPTGGRRQPTNQGKPERLVAWHADIQIGTTAWRLGLPLATRNRRDFVIVRNLLADLYPDQPALHVIDPPRGDRVSLD